MRDLLSTDVLTADSNQNAETAPVRTLPVDKPAYHVTVEKRPLNVYAKAGET